MTPCHKGQSRHSGPCLAAYSGAHPCDRPGGHPGRCRCGLCGARFVGLSEEPPARVLGEEP